MSQLRSLLLTGGGARGAYQVGVLRAIAKIVKNESDLQEFPFGNFVGSSSGALNVSHLLTSLYHSDLEQAAQELTNTWLDLSTDKIYLSNWNYMAINGLKWIKSMTLAQGSKQPLPLSLLNPTPLYKILKENLSLHLINELIETGRIHSMAINCFCHNTGKTMTFFNCAPDAYIIPWQRYKREAIKTPITLKHIMASSAIPILFPPINVFGDYLADGNVRDYAPFSVPIHMGAKRILMISVKESFEEVYEKQTPPTTGKVISSLLDAIMSDSIDIDRERIERINQLVLVNEQSHHRTHHQHINYTIVRPSASVAKIALKHHDSLPNSVRYFLKGIGPKEETADLVSYILFERPYIEELIELGEKDGMFLRHAITQLLAA